MPNESSLRQSRPWCIFCSKLAMATVFAATSITAVASQQNSPQAAGSTDAKKLDRSQAYFHYAMGHIYQERGAMYNRPELLSQAVDELKLAMESDPGSTYLSLELAELYASTGRWQNALQETEDTLERHPEDLAARKLLGRLYLRVLMPDRGQQPNMDMQERAVKQFEAIIERDPNDVSSYLILSQLYRMGGENAKAETILKKAVTIQPDSAEANSNLALLYVDIGDFQAAINLLKQVTVGKPDPQLLGTLAYAYEQTQNYKEAATAYSNALEADPENSLFRRGLGQNLLLTRQYDQAKEQFEALIEANPRDVEAYLRLSQVYRVQRKFQDARQTLTKAIELAPDNPDLQFNQVLNAEAEGKLPEAITLIKKILDASAKSSATPYSSQERASRAIFLEKLGYLYRDSGDMTAAQSAFREMIPLGRENAIRGELHLIEIYQESKDLAKALEAADRLSKEYPDSREVTMTRASVLASLGKTQEAVDVIKPLMKDNDDDRELWVTIARLYQDGKQFDKAQAALTKAEALSETDPEKENIHFLYGSLWERQKQFTKAEQEFRRVLEINPESAMTLNYLGYMWADQGLHLDEAVAMIQKALDMEPNSGAYMDSLGWAYYKQNKTQLAIEYLEKASQRLGSDPTILDHLADVYYSAGRVREAQMKWQAAIAEWAKLPKSDVDDEDVAKVEKKLKDAVARLTREPQSAKQ